MFVFFMFFLGLLLNPRVGKRKKKEKKKKEKNTSETQGSPDGRCSAPAVLRLARRGPHEKNPQELPKKMFTSKSFCIL